MIRRLLPLSLPLLLLCSCLVRAEGEKFIPLSHVPDPPPAIDGTLQRFETVPGWLHIDQKDQVVVHADQWAGPKDLSAEVIAAWDSANLYLAAKVVDKASGGEKAKQAEGLGSYVLLSLEVPRRPAAQRSKGSVYQIELRPRATDSDSTTPQLYRRFPKPGVPTKTRCSSQMVEDGYWIEAAIPWEQLGLGHAPTEGTRLGIDISLHSNAGDAAAAEGAGRIMSLHTAEWELGDSHRLGEAVLAASDGSVDPAKMPKSAVPISDLTEIEGGKSADIALKAPDPLRVVDSGVTYPCQRAAIVRR